MGARVLFSEGSSLTAHEFVNVLGPAGHDIEIVDPNSTCIGRFRRWTRRVQPCPLGGSDPLGYLETINTLLATGAFDVLLPTREQAWLFAAGRARLDPMLGSQLPPPTHSRVSRARLNSPRLLDEVGLLQPKWQGVESPEWLADWPMLFHLKAPFTTAGTGVRRVAKPSDAKKAFESLLPAAEGGALMVQSAEAGEYRQPQG